MTNVRRILGGLVLFMGLLAFGCAKPPVRESPGDCDPNADSKVMGAQCLAGKHLNAARGDRERGQTIVGMIQKMQQGSMTPEQSELSRQLSVAASEMFTFEDDARTKEGGALHEIVQQMRCFADALIDSKNPTEFACWGNHLVTLHRSMSAKLEFE